jgi:preprotein translocase subunit SecE
MKRKKQNSFLRQLHHSLDALLKIIYPHKGFSSWKEIIAVLGSVAVILVLFVLGMRR